LYKKRPGIIVGQTQNWGVDIAMRYRVFRRVKYEFCWIRWFSL